MKRSWIAFATLLFGFATTSLAQKPGCMDRVMALNAQTGRPVQQWTPAIVNDLMQQEMTIYSDCVLWDPDLHQLIANYTTDWEPTVQVNTSDVGLRSPSNKGKVITFPSDFGIYLFEISLFLGHDADVRSSSIHLPYELASTPFRRTQLAPLFNPLSKYLDPDFFQPLVTSLTCPEMDQGCKALAGYSAELPVLFVLLHENAHQHLHHVNNDGLNLQQELEADASALAAFKIIRDSLLPSLPISASAKTQVRWIFDVAPAIWLKADSLRLAHINETGQAAQVAEARLQAIVKADPAISKKLLAYVTPAHSNSNMTTIHIQFDHAVQSYVIDGIRLLPAQLPAGGLIVTNASHTIIALCPDGVGVSQNYGDPDFTFADFSPVSTEKVQKDRDDNKWELVLAETSDINLQPRSPALAGTQSIALDNLGLGALIAPGVTSLIQGDDLQSVQEAQRNAVTLASWRYITDRAIAH